MITSALTPTTGFACCVTEPVQRLHPQPHTEDDLEVVVVLATVHSE